MRTPTTMTLLLFLAVLSVVSSAAAQTSGPTPRPGHFTRVGDTSFACVTRSENSNSANVLGECLRVGPFRIGSRRGEAAILVGSPLAQVGDGSGGMADIHALSWSGKPDVSDLTSYLAVAYDDAGQAKSLQVSGASAPCCWRFSGLALGDSTDAITRTFGPAFSVEPVAANGADLWLYGEWPFSFEVTNGRITSIRVTARPSAQASSIDREASEPRDLTRRRSDDPIAREAVTNYRACATDAAARLERSAEAANIVAAAALESCGAERSAAIEAVAGSDWRYASVFGRTLDERTLSEAQTRVVSIRAARR